MQYFWEALNNFTNGEWQRRAWCLGSDSTCGIPRQGRSCRAFPAISADADLLHAEDRSRFLRFVTGRSRLPARIYIYPDKLG